MVDYKNNKSDSTGEIIEKSSFLCYPEKLKEYKTNQASAASIGPTPSKTLEAADTIKGSSAKVVSNITATAFGARAVEQCVIDLQPICNKMLDAVKNIRGDADDTREFILSQENCNYVGGDIQNQVHNLITYKKNELTAQELYDTEKNSNEFIDSALVEIPNAINGIAGKNDASIAHNNNINTLDNTLYYNLPPAIDPSTLTQTEIDAFNSTGNGWVLE